MRITLDLPPVTAQALQELTDSQALLYKKHGVTHIDPPTIEEVAEIIIKNGLMQMEFPVKEQAD